MSYQHDIFISYRRNHETFFWITEHFVPLLTLRVELELGRKPLIYVDNQIESGTSWPASLGAAIGASRVLIALWSGNYLASVWCAEELSHMLGREREAKLRTVDRPHGVVIPAFIHDGDRFPAELAHIEHFEVQKSFNVRMARNSPRAEELDAALAAQAPAIAACINHAPAWRRAWPKEAAAGFFRRFYQQAEALQTTVPRFTGR
jgi:hypothetical protein